MALISQAYQLLIAQHGKLLLCWLGLRDRWWVNPNGCRLGWRSGHSAHEAPAVPAYQSLVGDINGDGKADLIWDETISGNYIYIGLSQGNGSFTITPKQIVGIAGWQNYRTLVGDVNGDGKADLIWDESLNVSNCVYSVLSNGDGGYAIKGAQCF